MKACLPLAAVGGGEVELTADAGKGVGLFGGVQGCEDAVAEGGCAVGCGGVPLCAGCRLPFCVLVMLGGTRIANSLVNFGGVRAFFKRMQYRSEEHTSELQSLRHLLYRLLLEKI